MELLVEQVVPLLHEFFLSLSGNFSLHDAFQVIWPMTNSNYCTQPKMFAKKSLKFRIPKLVKIFMVQWGFGGLKVKFKYIPAFLSSFVAKKHQIFPLLRWSKEQFHWHLQCLPSKSSSFHQWVHCHHCRNHQNLVCQLQWIQDLYLTIFQLRTLFPWYMNHDHHKCWMYNFCN